jgi:hypothetical protein
MKVGRNADFILIIPLPPCILSRRTGFKNELTRQRNHGNCTVASPHYGARMYSPKVQYLDWIQTVAPFEDAASPTARRSVELLLRLHSPMYSLSNRPKTVLTSLV